MRLESMWTIAQRAALAGAAALGLGLVRRAGLAEVRSLWPTISPLAALKLAAEHAGHRVTNGLVRRARRRLGDAWLERAIEVRNADALRGPALVATWHAGLATAVTAGLAQLGRSGVVLRFEATGTSHHGFREVATGRDTKRGALAMMAAITALRRNEVVTFVAGVVHYKRAPDRSALLPFMGREVYVAPGVATMARLAGVPIVPALAFVERGRIVLELGDPITPSPDDRETVRALLAYFEPRFTARPDLLWETERRRISRSPEAS